MIFEAGGLICKTAPINTVRAELSLFWAIGAAGFCYGFHGSARSDGRVRNFRDAQLPRTIRQEPCRAGLSSHRANDDGIMFVQAHTELQRGLQIGFSDHDGDGDTARLVASSDKDSSIGQDNASRRFSHRWAAPGKGIINSPGVVCRGLSGGRRVFGTRSSTRPPPATRARIGVSQSSCFLLFKEVSTLRCNRLSPH